MLQSGNGHPDPGEAFQHCAPELGFWPSAGFTLFLRRRQEKKFKKPQKPNLSLYSNRNNSEGNETWENKLR